MDNDDTDDAAAGVAGDGRLHFSEQSSGEPAPLTVPSAPPGGMPRDDFERTAALHQLLQQARQLAASLNHPEVDLEHLLIVLALDGSSRRILEAEGVDPVGLRKGCFASLADRTPTGAHRDESDLRFTGEVSRLLTETADRAIAREPEHRHVGLMDVATTVLADRSRLDRLITPAPASDAAVLAQIAALTGRFDAVSGRINAVAGETATTVDTRLGRVEAFLAHLNRQLGEGVQLLQAKLGEIGAGDQSLQTAVTQHGQTMSEMLTVLHDAMKRAEDAASKSWLRHLKFGSSAAK